MLWGVVFVLIGVFALLDNLAVIDLDFGEIIAPVFLIAWGMRLLWKKNKSEPK